jgi:hypothetical protein
VAVRPVRLRPRPVFLAGPEGLLADLDARLAGGAGGLRMVALCGLGGTGKTSLALEYGYRHLAGLGLVWQFPAEEPTELAAGFGVLAAELGVADRQGGGDPVAQVHGLPRREAPCWFGSLPNGRLTFVARTTLSRRPLSARPTISSESS